MDDIAAYVYIWILMVAMLLAGLKAVVETKAQVSDLLLASETMPRMGRIGWEEHASAGSSQNVTLTPPRLARGIGGLFGDRGH